MIRDALLLKTAPLFRTPVKAVIPFTIKTIFFISRDPRSRSSHQNDKIYVLDIAGTAPQPTQCVALVLKRPDKRRKSTQTWRFTEDGRLCCAHNNMCVQAKDGFFGLRQGKFLF